MYEAPKPHFEDTAQYEVQLNHILNTPLTPENIHTYADDALQQLIGLVQTATEDYQTAFPDMFATTRDMEDAAFHYFGLQDIEAVLDYVNDVGKGINSLDGVVQRAGAVDYVITPPESGVAMDLSPRSGSFQEKRIEPRLKTVLFVLQQDFGVNVHDPEQLTLTAGMVPDRMMRRASYYQVTVPKLERMLLVCDEYGQMTYIFDVTSLDTFGLSQEHIGQMTKGELNALLHEHYHLGQKVRHHPQSFVARLRAVLQEPGKTAPTARRSPSDNVSYLRPQYPKAPEGILSIHGLANKLGSSHERVDKALSRLIASGKVEIPLTYFFGKKLTKGLAPSHQDAVAQVIAGEDQHLSEAPEGFLSISGLAAVLHVDGKTVKHLYFDQLRDGAIPEAETFLFHRVATLGLSPSTQFTMVTKLYETNRNHTTRENAAQFLAKLDKRETAQSDEQ